MKPAQTNRQLINKFPRAGGRLIKGPKRRALLFMLGLLGVSCVVSVVVLSERRQSQTKQPKDWLRSIPAVESKVKNLQIINPRIVRAGTEMPGVEFEVLNNSDKAVMAIEIACGKRSIAKDGLEDEENPTAIIKPYGTLQAEMSGALEPDKPLVITAAVFDDGKEEGVRNSLELMHKVRNRQRESLKARKAQTKSEDAPKP
jgi:hypothetical protein